MGKDGLALLTPLDSRGGGGGWIVCSVVEDPGEPWELGRLVGGSFPLFCSRYNRSRPGEKLSVPFPEGEEQEGRKNRLELQLPPLGRRRRKPGLMIRSGAFLLLLLLRAVALEETTPYMEEQSLAFQLQQAKHCNTTPSLQAALLGYSHVSPGCSAGLYSQGKRCKEDDEEDRSHLPSPAAAACTPH